MRNIDTMRHLTEITLEEMASGSAGFFRYLRGALHLHRCAFCRRRLEELQVALSEQRSFEEGIRLLRDADQAAEKHRMPQRRPESDGV